MDYIRFRHNFCDKLSQKSFTTIRVDDPIRYQVGNIYNVLGPDQDFEAKLSNIQLVYDLNDIPIEYIQSDTGLTSREEFNQLLSEFYGDLSRTRWAILTLKRL